MTVIKQLGIGPQSDGTWRDIVYVHQTMIDGKPDWEYEEIWHCDVPKPWQGYKVLREEWIGMDTKLPTRHIHEIEIQ